MNLLKIDFGRNQNGESLRVTSDSRKNARLNKKIKKKEEKNNMIEEVKRLKNIKKEEILKRIEKIKNISGLKNIKDQKNIEDFLEEEYDENKFHKNIENLFDNEYYDVDDEYKVSSSEGININFFKNNRKL